MQKILDLDGLDQNILHFDSPRSKYFAPRPRSYAPDQNPLDLIGFLVVHPSPDRSPHWQHSLIVAFFN
jgi:hypothetical protein